MLYVVLATFAAGMATEYFLGNRWIGFFAVGVPACLYFFYLDYQKRAAAKKEEEEKETLILTLRSLQIRTASTKQLRKKRIINLN